MKVATPRVATTPANMARIEAMAKAMEHLMIQLGQRWLDECKYEDIAEYQERIERDLFDGFKIIKMTKRPFGFHFSIGTDAVYHLYCSAAAYGWKRIV